MKEAYIEKINELMQKTDDIALLDLVWKLLVKTDSTNEDEE